MDCQGPSGLPGGRRRGEIRPSDHQGAVVAAKAEGVRQHDPDLPVKGGGQRFQFESGVGKIATCIAGDDSP